MSETPIGILAKGEKGRGGAGEKEGQEGRGRMYGRFSNIESGKMGPDHGALSFCSAF